ncbi:hypothetical protein BG004_006539, partial [Podila humilis]
MHRLPFFSKDNEDLLISLLSYILRRRSRFNLIKKSRAGVCSITMELAEFKERISSV